MIGVVGLWHLGVVYSAGLADLGQRVLGYDEDSAVVEGLKKGLLPVYEPNLSELIVKQQTSGQLQYTSDLTALGDCDIIWIAMDTPLLKDGGPDVHLFENLFRKMLPHIAQTVTIVVSSQVPVGTSQKMTSVLKEIRPDVHFSYVYQPENLQLGQALRSFMTPSRIVVGTNHKESAALLQSIFSPLNVPIHAMRTASAEMTKHALNAFLGTSLSFMYDIADLCEVYGADILEVSRALKSDPRIGHHAYLDASLGFSGGTLDRDLSAVVRAARESDVEVPVIEQAMQKNADHWQIVVSFLTREIADLSHATIGILGMTYKPGTSTLRHSLSMRIAHALEPLVLSVRCHDPLAPRDEIAQTSGCVPCEDIYDACEGAAAILLMTSSAEYAHLDFARIAERMVGEKIFFDAKNFLWEQEHDIQKNGLRYRGVGRGVSTV